MENETKRKTEQITEPTERERDRVCISIQWLNYPRRLNRITDIKNEGIRNPEFPWKNERAATGQQQQQQ